MKRGLTILALTLGAASPAAAQWAGMPVWNNPKGGTGVTISGDYGKPNADAGKGNAFGARAALGLGNITLGLGVVSYKPAAFNSAATGVAGTAAFRAIGGSLIPISLNLQAGAGTLGQLSAGATNVPKQTTITAGGGISTSVPTPGLSIEPYLSITNRWHKLSGVSGTESNIGWTIGANLGLGMLGFHFAYDSEKRAGGKTAGIIGLGAHVALKAPIGM